MSIIERATQRLEELTRAGVEVPWAAAGRGQTEAPKTDLGASMPVTAARGVGDSTVRSEEDVPEPFRPPAPPRAPAVVMLDQERLADAGYLVPSQTRSPLAEEFRQLKRPLLKNALAEDASARRLGLIMVTSALPGEGKTTCSINLAMSMSTELDVSVLLVDADVLRPDVPDALGFEAARGLLDLLASPGMEVSELVLKTSIPKLSILPAGKPHQLSTELLASEAMESLLDVLRHRYLDHVLIFDAPPLLVTNEARVLASRMGQVIMVVDASKTPPAAVSEAFALVEQCPVVMSLLNKAPAHVAAMGYGYYHYG